MQLADQKRQRKEEQSRRHQIGHEDPPADRVGAAVAEPGQRIAGQLAGRGYDLLLINHDAVSIRADFLEQWMQVLDRGASLLRLYVFGNQLHRARSIKRDQGDDIV